MILRPGDAANYSVIPVDVNCTCSELLIFFNVTFELNVLLCFAYFSDFDHSSKMLQKLRPIFTTKHKLDVPIIFQGETYLNCEPVFRSGQQIGVIIGDLKVIGLPSRRSTLSTGTTIPSFVSRALPRRSSPAAVQPAPITQNGCSRGVVIVEFQLCTSNTSVAVRTKVRVTNRASAVNAAESEPSGLYDRQSLYSCNSEACLIARQSIVAVQCFCTSS